MTDRNHDEYNKPMDAASKWINIGIIVIVAVMFVLYVSKADAREPGDIVFKTGVYHPLHVSAAEYGSGAIVTVTLNYYLTESVSVGVVHKSRFGTGWPYLDGDCATNTRYCESTFEGVAVSYEKVINLF